jgi:hypothetical protein
MNMLDPENLGSFGHGQSHGGCEVAGATADIKSIPGTPKFVDEEFESPGVHMRCRDGGPETNRLRGVVVRRGRSVVLPVHVLHDLADVGVPDDALLDQPFYKFVHLSIIYCPVEGKSLNYLLPVHYKGKKKEGNIC